MTWRMGIICKKMVSQYYVEIVGKIPAEVVEIKCVWNNCPSIFVETSVQEKLTVGRWRTEKGRWIEERWTEERLVIQ